MKYCPYCGADIPDGAVSFYVIITKVGILEDNRNMKVSNKYFITEFYQNLYSIAFIRL